MDFTRTEGRLDADIKVTSADVEQALCAPSSFAYFGGDRDKMFVSWSLGPVVRHRDSDLLQQSNAAALLKLLNSDPSLVGDWRITNCSHWMVGWVDHLSFRAVDDDGGATRVFRVVKEWLRALREEYPIADEDDLSEREHADTLKTIEVEGRRLLAAGAPTDWVYEMWSWFVDHDERAVEPRDGWGGCPTTAQLRAALGALGWLQDERGEVRQ